MGLMIKHYLMSTKLHKGIKCPRLPPPPHKIDHRRFIAASLIYESPGVGLIISRLKRHRSVFSLYDDLEKEAEEITVHWSKSCSLHLSWFKYVEVV